MPAAAAAGGESLLRGERIRRRPEYLRAYRRGRRRAGAFVILHFTPNELGLPRLGVTVSKKVGNSVVRHRVKRRIVETFRRLPSRRELGAWDVVVHVKPEAAGAAFAALRGDVEGLLRGLAAGRR
jgi:ribonuclease P protein component